MHSANLFSGFIGKHHAKTAIKSHYRIRFGYFRYHYSIGLVDFRAPVRSHQRNIIDAQQKMQIIYSKKKREQGKCFSDCLSHAFAPLWIFVSSTKDSTWSMNMIAASTAFMSLTSFKVNDYLCNIISLNGNLLLAFFFCAGEKTAQNSMKVNWHTKKISTIINPLPHVNGESDKMKQKTAIFDCKLCK